jgi:tRNA uridine 5-carboxymethylaminomethyl modification enzyme
MKKFYDIVVIGAGHAGIESSLAAAKMGCSVGLFTMDVSAVGRMSCNPAIGGTAKGHLVREVDALGGVMGKLADRTGIQFKMLNKSKGPAVWSPRCQSDKILYSIWAAKLVNDQDNIDLVQNMVNDIIVEKLNTGSPYCIKGIKTASGHEIECKCIIITSGTFLNAIMHTGKSTTLGGRNGEDSAIGLTKSLTNIGFETGRLKTGTPPRLDINTIDFSKTEVQPGDKKPQPFSYSTNGKFPKQEQVDCFLTHTNERTHDILRTGFEDSPLFSGRIRGIGPRYCPSIEDKISRFSDKSRHQIFLEPETLNGNTVYMNGFSTSLPLEVQEKAARTVKGLENVELVLPGYAVEYDFLPTHQINLSLETKLVSGLFTAGQINGTSGYEEAAGQGIVAGINAAQKLKNEDPLMLKRSEAYIGVLIDDLINKCPYEPYRMFTSSAEYRLILRQDNADLRLMEKGYFYGLITSDDIKKLNKKRELIKEGINYLTMNTISPKLVNEYMISKNTSPINQNDFIANLIKRNPVRLSELLQLDAFKNNSLLKKISNNLEAINQIELEIKYNGYIQRQNEQVEKFNKNEEIKIPKDFNYDKIKSISTEALYKLKSIKPQSIGQAARIAGVRPSDISAIFIYMRG